MKLLTHERMSPGFEKWHVQGMPLQMAFHRFTEPDQGDPHDHPWSFTTHILSGSYVEEVFGLLPAGGWMREVHHRQPGTVHNVMAGCIHRIVELPHGECWTLVVPSPKVREPRFWKFGEIVQSRRWDEKDFS